MDRQVAEIVKEHSTTAIRELHSILLEIRDQCTGYEFEMFKRGVGFSMGEIQMKLLELVNAQYPDLDDLRD